MTRPPGEPAGVGDTIGPVVVGPIAHGGHWVARAEDGRVVFVRGALEGETVRVRLTATARRHAFGEVIDVLQASPRRVPAPCAIAGRCGGCDFQHVDPDAQADLKRQVVAEQLGRLAGLAWGGTVERVEPVLAWRTRVRYHADAGAWGMHPHRSHEVTPLPASGCLIAAPGLERPSVPAGVDGDVIGVAAADGVRWLQPGDASSVLESAAGRPWRVRADGFWQVHPRAADTLVAAVLAGLSARPGDEALDLYAGVGLFAGALADADVRVIGVEADRAAVELARANVPAASFVAGPVERVLGPGGGRRGRRLGAPDARILDAVDLVVLDPPRAGAGPAVLDAIAARTPRAVAYVACDPAALARDLGHAGALGWRLASLRAFDLFPMTHHVECVAILLPTGSHAAS